MSIGESFLPVDERFTVQQLLEEKQMFLEKVNKLPVVGEEPNAGNYLNAAGVLVYLINRRGQPVSPANDLPQNPQKFFPKF